MAIEEKGRRSVKLTPDEKKALRKFITNQPTKEIAAQVIGIAPNTLDRILLAGSGAYESIEKIRNKVAA